MAQMNGELPGGQALGPAQGSTRTAHLPSRHSRMREAESEILDSNVVSPDNRSPLPILNPTEEEEAAVSPAHLAVDCEFYKNKRESRSRKLMEENDSMRERMNGLEDMVRRLNAKLEQQDTSRVLVPDQKRFCMSRIRRGNGLPKSASSRAKVKAAKRALAKSLRAHMEVLAASIAAAKSHFHSSPLQTPLAPSNSGASRASNLPRKRPLSAFPSRATASPVCQRPASAIGVRERFTQAGPKQVLVFAALLSLVVAARRPETLSTVFHIVTHSGLNMAQLTCRAVAVAQKHGCKVNLLRAFASHGLVIWQGDGSEVLAFCKLQLSECNWAWRHFYATDRLNGPPPPLPPLPPELAEKEPSPEAQTAASGQDEDDFTAEERRLEQESEEALNQLEALDAAVDALRFKLEVSRDDLESSGAELQQLRCAAESWAKAAEESRRELHDREQRLEENLKPCCRGTEGRREICGCLQELLVEEALCPSEAEKEPHKSLADERPPAVTTGGGVLLSPVLSEGLCAWKADGPVAGAGSSSFLRSVQTEGYAGVERRALEAQLEAAGRSSKSKKRTPDCGRGGPPGAVTVVPAGHMAITTGGPVPRHWRAQPRAATQALSALARIAKAEESRKLLRRMRTDEVETNIFHFSSAISACEKAANWLLALDTLHTMVGCEVLPNLVSYCSSVSACEKASEWLIALGLFAEMRPRQVIPNVIAFSSAISACGKGGEWQLALQLFATMAANEVIQDVVSYASMISAAAQGGQWRLAVDVLRLMINDQITPNVVSYNSAISACERGRQWKPALQLLKSMSEAAKSPDVVSYSAAISACANLGEWQRALSLLTRMGQKKVPPNTVSFNATISAAEKAQDWLLALDLLSMMRRAKVPLSVVTFSSAISACEKALAWQASLELLSAMPALKVAPNQVTYNSAISACDVGSQWRQAAALLDCMLDVAIAQDELSYSAAISAASRCGQWMHGLALLAEMPRRSVCCDAVARDASLRACVKAHKWQAALLLLHVVPDTALGCSLVLDGCEAGNCAELMPELMSRLHGVLCRARSLSMPT
ncbi:unnamed protein product [Symbiodinium sp. CCMP2592]|nr:unnamed protein product [Symbiodinium sp. CCMP2592]